MTTLTLLHSVGSIGAFANRAFLPAFLTALFLRFAPQLDWLSWIPLLQQIKDTPIWFTHDITLIILGALSAIEVIFHKSATWREWTQNGQEWLQTGVATLTTFGVISASDARFALEATPLASLAASAPMSAGLNSAPIILAALVGIGTLIGASLLARVERGLVMNDPDDTFGLGKIFSWTRDLSAIGFLVAALLLPGLAVALVLLLLGGLALLAWSMARAEKRGRIPCTACQQPISRSAPHCPHCHASNTQVRAVNWLGYPSRRPAGPHHEFDLLAVARCPHCAEFLASTSVPTRCSRCKQQALTNSAEIEAYLSRVRQRVPWVLAWALGCSFLPALGFALSYLVNRLAIARPLRAHTPAPRRFIARLGQKLITALALLFHWLPFFGQILLPLLTWVTWRSHRRAFPHPESQEIEATKTLPA